MSQRRDEKLTTQSPNPDFSEKQVNPSIEELSAQLNDKDAEIESLKQQLFFRTQEATYNQKLQQVVFKISELAIDKNDLTHFYRSLHDIINQLFNTENFCLLLLTDNKNALQCAYASEQCRANLPELIGLNQNNIITYLFEQTSAILLTEIQINQSQFSDDFFFSQQRPRSILGTPLVVDGSAIGMMFIHSYSEDHYFEERSCQLFDYIGNMVASTLLRKLQKLNLEHKYADRTDKLTEEIRMRRMLQKTENTLLNIAELANSKISLNAFYFEIHRLISTLIYARNLYIVLREGNLYRFAYYSDSKDDTSLSDFKAYDCTTHKSLTARLFRSDQPLVLRNEDIELLAEQGEIIRRGPKTRSWLGIPLRIDEETIGAIVLQSYIEEKIYNDKDMLLMEYVAKPVANAIQRKSVQSQLEELVNKRTLALQDTNKKLQEQFDEVTKAEKLHSALYEIANLASGAEDLYKFFDNLFHIIRQFFQTENFYIGLAEGDSLVIHYARDELDGQLIENMKLPINKNTLTTVLYRSNQSLLIDPKDLDDLIEKYNFKLIGSLFESWLGVTLKNNNKNIGIMVIQSYHKDIVYSEWHRDLLEFIAHHVAIAIERKRYKFNLEKEIKERTEELEKEIEIRKETESTQSALYQIANLANMDIELELFYQQIHQIIGTLLYSENLYIAIQDEKNDQIKMVHYVDTMDDFDVNSFSEMPAHSLKNSLTGFVMRQGKPLLTTKKGIAELVKKHKLKTLGEETVSWLGVPLMVENKVIGIMALQSYLPDFYYTEKDKELMIFVGQHVATAIQRKRNQDFLEFMVEERTNELNLSNEQLKYQIKITEKSKKLQTALFQIADLASGAESMNRLYSAIHEIIMRLIGAENLYICLYDKTKEKVEFVYFVDIEDEMDIEQVCLIPSSDILKTSTGKVLLTGESILRTPDNTSQIIGDDSYIGKRSLYWLGVPLKLENNILGMIATQSYDEHKKLGNEDRNLLEFVSHQIALTLERKQAQEALEKRVEERTYKLAETNASLEQQVIERERSELIQATLYYVSKLANKDISLQTLFAEIHVAIKELIYAESFYVALWNESLQEMNWIYFYDDDDGFDYSFLEELPKEQRNRSLARHVVVSGEPLMVDKRRIELMAEDGVIILMGPTSEYYLGVPLVGSEGVAGVMAVQSYMKDIQYTESDKELLIFVAQSIMSTIERHEYHSQLEESVRKRTQELTVSNQLLQKEIIQRKQAVELQKALFKISEMPQLCTTEQELYSRLHETISNLMVAKNFYIAIANKDFNQFEMKYVVDEYDVGMNRIPFNIGLTGYVYECGEITHFTKSDIQQLEAQGRLKCIGPYPIDWVGVPLISSGDILGIMVLQSYDEGNLFGEKEVNILNFVSTHIAEALQRKYAERKLNKAYSELAEKTKKAEEANAAKSTFLATVSHEIRTPMNGILGMLSLLGETSLSRKQRDYVSKSSTSARTLLAIINDILDFSKMEHGKLELENINFNLLEVLENITDLFSSKVNEKQIDFCIDLSANVALERNGDSLRLSQVLINLIGNAVKFTETGYILLIVSESQSGILSFVVKDTGIGIDVDKRDKIFQSFTQADDATTRRFGGSGLGLSICQQLVSMMGGEIRVDGELGVGSIFSFDIRIAVNESAEIPHYNFKNVSAVFVSDTDYQITAWEHICARFDIEFNHYHVEQIMQNDFNIKFSATRHIHVFIDDEVKEITGLEIAEKLRQKISEANYYLLIQPAPHLSELPFLEYDIQVLPKPVKVGMLLSRLNKNFRSFSQPKQINDCKLTNQLKGINILLAEDNPINQQVAREIIQDFGATITIVDNGKKAVDLVNTHPFDIVLLDMQMPVMDGYRATQIIRETISADKLPVIAMTANVMKGDRERCIDCGMNDFIGKPFERLELFEVIKNNLTGDKKIKIDEEKYQFECRNNCKDKAIANDNHPFNLQYLSDKFGSEDFALELIKMFHENHSNDSIKIMELVRAKDFLAAEKIVHKLKGSAGELGMDELFQLAEKVDLELKSNRAPTSRNLKLLSRTLMDYIVEIELVI
ncbi:GAF domain-containing protein [Aliikangiella maris]|uniref:GAF domain-containing protein n=2 Tax=Aliikangiella maris TaxID=3162458 RepID=A0ABV3MRV0_9GAMM